MSKALLLIDLQNDFVDGGALPVPDGLSVIPVANRLVDQFTTVIATQDWHPPDHLSFASQHPGKKPGDVVLLDGIEQVLWPDHCVQQTQGAEFVADLNVARIAHVVRKGTDRRIDSYSGFFDNRHRRATGLHDLLQRMEIRRLFVMGLATDYCVKFTVLDGLELGYEVSVVEDGCRGVELHPGDVETAIRQMASAGAQLVNSDAIETRR